MNEVRGMLTKRVFYFNVHACTLPPFLLLTHPLVRGVGVAMLDKLILPQLRLLVLTP